MVNLDDYKPRDVSKGYNWIKIRTSLIDDPKYMRLSDVAKVTFFEAYLLAGKSDAGGLILAGDDPAMIHDLAWILRRSDADLQNILDELQRAGLVNLDDDQVTVCKFANEQGPDASEKRKQWALRQAKRRALAKGEVWIEPVVDADQEPDQDQEPEKSQNPEKEKEKTVDAEQIQNQTKTKRVTHTSRDNHAVVTRDSIDDDVLAFGDDVLDVWRELKGSDYKPSQKFWQMIQDWYEAGVTKKHVKWALIQTSEQAQTPFYVRELAVTMRDDDPEVQNQKNLEKFRQLYRQSKNQAGGDNDVHE
jgi:hypothetical protein